MNIKDEFIVAIDFGLKRTGLAVSSKGLSMALPSHTIKTEKDDTKTIASILKLYPETIDRFIVGLPIHLDGTKSEMSSRVETFCAQLKAQTGKPVHLIDERLTSDASETLLKDLGHNRKERSSMKDSLSAQLILKDFLQSHSYFE